jgi:hypothetical protein
MELLIVIIIIAFCILLFGKADSKREVLSQVGLDLSEKSYENKKESEFEKYCKKAMKEAVNGHDVLATNERDFLINLDNVLDFACMGFKYEHDYDSPAPNLYVKQHYIKFASTVVGRRLEALNKNTSVLYSNCNYSSKRDLRKYIDLLWKKYQYP